MVALTTPLQKTLGSKNVVKSSARAFAEFNCNRYFSVTASNAGLEDYDPDLFPIDSIVQPNRPQKPGIVKAIAGSGAEYNWNRGIAADAFWELGYTGGARYYTCSPEDQYKYWVSPNVSSATATAGAYPITQATPQIIYSVPVATNKLVIGLENSYTNPSVHYVDITTDGTNWTQVIANPIVNSNGQVVVYLQNADGTSWSQTKNLTNTTLIRGIRYRVTSIDKPQVFLKVIEMSARMEADITPYLIEANAEASMSDHSFVTPIGRVSSNSGSITLSNINGIFNNENTSSPFAGMVDANVDITVDIGIDTTASGGVAQDWTRHLTMKTENWTPSELDKIVARLKDDSAILQGIKPLPMLMERPDIVQKAEGDYVKAGFSQMTAGEIAWRILDSVGYNNYVYDPAVDNETGVQIPFFWVDGEKSVWEIFDDLSQATQTAFYFDKYGVLQIKTMTAAIDQNKTPIWDFTSGDVSSEKSSNYIDATKISDIQELTRSYDYEANKVDVNYRVTKMTDENRSQPIMETVWEPDGSFVLRSTALTRSMTPTDTTMYVDPADVATWPYSGVVQVEGEFIRYDAKAYRYMDTNGSTWKTAWVTTNEQKATYDAKYPNRAYQNAFDGRLRITERGVWTSIARSHSVDLSGWGYNRVRSGTNLPYFWNGGIKHDKANSIMKVATNKSFSTQSWYVGTRGSRTDVAPNYYGTRMRFPKSGYSYGAAGMVISAGDNDSGIYIELIRTKVTGRVYAHELGVYVKLEDGSTKRYGPDGGKGVPIAITEGTWYDMDIKFDYSGSNKVVQVSINGVNRLVATIPAAGMPSTPIGGRYGFELRGFTAVDYEYMYSSSNGINNGYDPFDQEGWFDRIQGGYISGQWDREWVYGYTTRTLLRGKKRETLRVRNNSRLMDEFGPIVHEVREMDVKFTKTPVAHSRIYISNDTQVICPEYTGDPFGAKFVLANTARVNSIANGEDTLMFGPDSPVDQKLMIYGRTITQEDSQTHTVKDEQAITARGESGVTIESQWIQSKSAAEKIGKWITAQWAGVTEGYEIDVFGNPLIDIGDVVTVTHKLGANASTATPKYVPYSKMYVVEVNKGYTNKGLTTTLTLRKFN